MRLLNLFFIAIAALIFVGIAQAESAKIVSPGSLQWKDVPNYPGVKMAVVMGDPDSHGPFVIRIKIPANYTFQSHTHPGDVMDTVLSGTLYYGEGNQANPQQTKPLKAGTFIMIPADSAHYAMTKQETILQVGGRGPWGMNAAK